MRERTNRTVSKTVVSQGTVGSNPTPSASSEVVFRSGLGVRTGDHPSWTPHWAPDGCASALAGTRRERSPGVWELRARAGRDPLAGKHRQVSRTFRGSSRQASKALAKLTTNSPESKLLPTRSTARTVARWSSRAREVLSLVTGSEVTKRLGAVAAE